MDFESATDRQVKSLARLTRIPQAAIREMGISRESMKVAIGSMEAQSYSSRHTLRNLKDRVERITDIHEKKIWANMINKYPSLISKYNVLKRTGLGSNTISKLTAWKQFFVLIGPDENWQTALKARPMTWKADPVKYHNEWAISKVMEGDIVFCVCSDRVGKKDMNSSGIFAVGKVTRKIPKDSSKRTFRDELPINGSFWPGFNFEILKIAEKPRDLLPLIGVIASQPVSYMPMHNAVIGISKSPGLRRLLVNITYSWGVNLRKILTEDKARITAFRTTAMAKKSKPKNGTSKHIISHRQKYSMTRKNSIGATKQKVSKSKKQARTNRQQGVNSSDSSIIVNGASGRKSAHKGLCTACGGETYDGICKSCEIDNKSKSRARERKIGSPRRKKPELVQSRKARRTKRT